MEGIPRVPMFAVELLIPESPLHPKFENNIREYIVMNYQDDPSKFNYAFREIEEMRNVVMQCVSNVESVLILKRYFCQMSMLKSRFPMEENDPLAVPFAWTDKSKNIPNSMLYSDINYELCCIMFNIGASHSVVAASETRSDSDSIKNAFMHFQYATWPMYHLQDKFQCGNFFGLFFNGPFLTFYSNMFMAQAQECILEKSMIDNRKSLVIAKVALKLKEYYEINSRQLDSLNTEHISVGKFKSLSRLCMVKYKLYSAISSFYLGQHADDEKKMGLRSSYLADALDHIKMALKIVKNDERESLKQAVKFAYDVIFQREEIVRKENDFIYHEKIIKPDEFEKIEGVVMVKPIEFDVNDSSVSGDDLFATLLPTNVLKTISLYSEEKLAFKRKIFDNAEEKDKELENYLISLQLNQLHLDEPIESVRLPDELLSSSAAFSSQPDAFPCLLNKFNQIMSMTNDAEQKVLQLTDRIKNVETSELAKDDGFKAIKAKVDELYSHHKKARENNAELQRVIAAQSENLKLLAMPLSQLTKEICGAYVNPMDHEEGVRLRKVLDKVDEMRLQRCQLLTTLESDLNNDDITKKALIDRDFNSKELFEKELKKHTKMTNLINQNLAAQQNILKALTEANANFAEFRLQIVESNEKRALHSLTLVTTYQVFIDVVEKTDEALSFYKQMFLLIAALLKGIKIIEETENKKRQQAKEKEEERRAAKESVDTLHNVSNLYFSCGEGRNLPLLPVEDMTNLKDIRSSVGNDRFDVRPRLGDYMDFYRNKMSGNVCSSMPANISSINPKTDKIYSTGTTPLFQPLPARGGEVKFPQNNVPDHQKLPSLNNIYGTNPSLQHTQFNAPTLSNFQPQQFSGGQLSQQFSPTVLQSMRQQQFDTKQSEAQQFVSSQEQTQETRYESACQVAPNFNEFNSQFQSNLSMSSNYSTPQQQFVTSHQQQQQCLTQQNQFQKPLVDASMQQFYGTQQLYNPGMTLKPSFSIQSSELQQPFLPTSSLEFSQSNFPVQASQPFHQGFPVEFAQPLQPGQSSLTSKSSFPVQSSQPGLFLQCSQPSVQSQQGFPLNMPFQLQSSLASNLQTATQNPVNSHINGTLPSHNAINYLSTTTQNTPTLMHNFAGPINPQQSLPASQFQSQTPLINTAFNNTGFPNFGVIPGERNLNASISNLTSAFQSNSVSAPSFDGNSMIPTIGNAPSPWHKNLSTTNPFCKL